MRNVTVSNKIMYVFEGPDGSGKSTAAKETVRRLKKEGRKVKHFIHPGGGTEASKKIRELFLSNVKMDIITQVHLILAARNELIQAIEDAFADGYIVVVERWDLSTKIYQINNLYLEETDENPYNKSSEIERLLEIADKSLFRRDISIKYFILMAPQEILNERVGVREVRDRFENSVDTFKRRIWDVYNQYAGMGTMWNTSFKRIDSSAKVDYDSILQEIRGNA